MKSFCICLNFFLPAKAEFVLKTAMFSQTHEIKMRFRK